jgi:hypothetical protein
VPAIGYYAEGRLLGTAHLARDVQVLDLAEQGWEVLLLAPGPGLVGAVVTGSPLLALQRFTLKGEG